MLPSQFLYGMGAGCRRRVVVGHRLPPSLMASRSRMYVFSILIFVHDGSKHMSHKKTNQISYAYLQQYERSDRMCDSTRLYGGCPWMCFSLVFGYWCLECRVILLEVTSLYWLHHWFFICALRLKNAVVVVVILHVTDRPRHWPTSSGIGLDYNNS